MTIKYLFLQGPVGSFFRTLSEELEILGCNTKKINFNGGDKYYWDGENAFSFTEDISKWADYIKDFAKLHNITDLVVYGDCRDIHKIAIHSLKPRGIRIHVFEEGYFRPNWITYETNGVNAYSSLPQQPNFYKELAKEDISTSVNFGASFHVMVWVTTCYYIACILRMLGRFKPYKHHYGVSPHYTMAMWVPKIAMSLWSRFRARHQQREVIKLPYFLVPLQLSRDYQIKEHSQFNSVPDFIAYVIESFAKNASSGNHLILKIHPLDNEPLKISKAVKVATEKYGIANRVRIIDGGHLPTLISHSKGVIVANSTTGLSAIHHHKPTIALSSAIYNFEGLTNQCKLDEFWQNPQIPDAELYKKFRTYVINNVQINGSFYVAKGIGIGAKIAAQKMFGVAQSSKAGA